MGAETFYNSVIGKNAEEAFRDAVEQAQYDYGHAGYTGTIAEKESFVMVPFNGEATLENAEKYAEDLLWHDDPRVGDKWGPAGCIELHDPRIQLKDGQHAYLFFGNAPS